MSLVLAFHMTEVSHVKEMNDSGVRERKEREKGEGERERERKREREKG